MGLFPFCLSGMVAGNPAPLLEVPEKRTRGVYDVETRVRY
jgi:hypothetical protein